MSITQTLQGIRDAKTLSEVAQLVPSPTFADAIADLANDTPRADASMENARIQAAVEAIGDLYPDKPIKSERDYKTAKAVNGYANSIYYNTPTGMLDEPSKEVLLNVIQRIERRLMGYINRTLIKDSKTSLLCRYALSDRYFSDENQAALLQYLHARGVLLKQVNDDGKVGFYIRGLKSKVGDNTFSVDRLGREHRRYLEVTAPQLYPVQCRNNTPYTLDSHDFISEVPTFDANDYYITGFGDHKGLSRRFPVDWYNIYSALHDAGCIR
jgi:hypothetical protein